MVICCKGRGGFKTFAKGVITVFQRVRTRLRTEALYILHHIYHDFKQIKYQVVFCSKTFEFQNVFSPRLLTPSLIPVHQVFQKQKLNNLLFVAAFLEHPSTQECYYAMLAHMLMLAIPTLVSVSEGFRKNNVFPLVCCSGHYQTIQQQAKTKLSQRQGWMVIPQVVHHCIVGSFINTNTLLCYVCLSRFLPAKKICICIFKDSFWKASLTTYFWPQWCGICPGGRLKG